MTLVQTNVISIIFPMQEREIINAPLTGKTCYILTAPSLVQKERYKSRKGWSRWGAFEKAKVPLFAAVVLLTPCICVCNDCWEAVLKVIGGWWPWTNMGICFAIHLVSFLMCGASQGAANRWRNKPFPPQNSKAIPGTRHNESWGKSDLFCTQQLV